jgi:hypothetical protein
MNVKEMWCLYDTILIGPGMKALGRGWFDSFAELAAANELPFFNQRNRSAVGVAYNNQDSAELMAFPFLAYSLGVEFLVMPFGDSCPTIPRMPFEKAPSDPVLQQQNEGVPQIFQGLMEHAAVLLKISQDEKLVNVITHQPAGFGTSGSAIPGGEVSRFGWIANYNNGEPEISNRYPWTIPLDMPRNVNWSAVVKFSNLAKYYLARLGGPETWGNSNDLIPDGENFVVAGKSVAAIRCSLIGSREVQQRGQLHA